MSLYAAMVAVAVSAIAVATVLAVRWFKAGGDDDERWLGI